MKVYAIMHGGHIKAVFSARERADWYLELLPTKDGPCECPAVEELDVDVATNQPRRFWYCRLGILRGGGAVVGQSITYDATDADRSGHEPGVAGAQAWSISFVSQAEAKRMAEEELAKGEVKWQAAMEHETWLQKQGIKP